MKTIAHYFLTTITACLICFTLFIPPVFSTQKDAIGKVIAIRGNAIATSEESKSRSLSLKAPVFLKDTIKTQNGRIQMMFKDNTLVTLGRNSEMQITKYLWEPGNTGSNMETNVQEGSFRIMGGAITRIAPNNFKTNAPSGTIGIRGSMYAGRVKGDSLFVLFQGGKGIYVQNKAGTVDITRPGFGTRVGSRGLPPEEPHKIDPKELQEFETLLTQAPNEDTESPSGQTESTIQPSSQADDTEKTKPEIIASGGTPPEIDNPPADPSTPPEIPPNPLPDPPIEPTLTPVGTEQKIQLLLIGLGVTDVTQSTTAPSSGIWKYKGVMENTLITEPNQVMKFVVNGDNNRIIGFEENSSGPTSPGFAFGTINPTTGEISNVKVLGSGGDPNGGEIMALTGSETFGHFYGASHGGLGLAMEGFDYNIRDQNLPPVLWSDILAGKLESTSTNPYSGSSEPWKGFFVGVAENMAAPDVNRRIFHNTNSNGSFNLTINKDAGTFTGTLSGEDFNNVANDITAFTIGGSNSDSAYLTDQILAATLSSGSIAIDIGGSTGPLKTYGNFMVTANEPMLSAYTTWGYWEVAYVDPDTGQDYHLHVPGSRWIAGKQTITSAMNTHITNSFTGTYTGKARGVMINTSGPMVDLTNGTTSLIINFAGGATPSIDGNISFTDIKTENNTLPDVTLLISSNTTLTNSGLFTATITNADTGSKINGAFFGPTAEAVGGNFNAQIGSTQYHGIFAGDLQP